MKQNAVLLNDGTVLRFDSAVNMIQAIVACGGDVIAFYMAGATAPAAVRPTTKEQQELIIAFKRHCLNHTA